MKDSKLKKIIIKLDEERYRIMYLMNLRLKYGIRIMNSKQTIKYIKKKRCSISRYGDGELSIIMGENIESFQSTSPKLQKKLREVIENVSPNVLVCMPRYLNHLRGCKKETKKFWNGWRMTYQKNVVLFLRKSLGYNYIFGDAELTRPYIDYRTSRNAHEIFPLIKELWNGKDLLIVEGEQTRLGVGNDLFEDAKSIKRVLCPPKNAFEKYDEILSIIKTKWNGELVLLALGATATIMAADLANQGIQALDVGHVDIEYEWMQMGAKWKCAIPGKYTNEVIDGRKKTVCEDESYLKQIIWTYK